MEKTGGMSRLEAVTGKDIRQIITEAVDQAGTVSAAAAELSLTESALYKWIRLLDGEVMTTTEVAFPDFSPAPAREEAAA